MSSSPGNRSSDSPHTPQSYEYSPSSPDATTILFERYEAKISTTKQNELALMATIAEQREEIAKLQNELQASQLDNQRMADEIDFLRQKTNVITQNKEVKKSEKQSAHAEAKKSPKVQAKAKRESKQPATVSEETIIPIKIEHKAEVQAAKQSSSPPETKSTSEELAKQSSSPPKTKPTSEEPAKQSSSPPKTKPSSPPKTLPGSPPKPKSSSPPKSQPASDESEKPKVQPPVFRKSLSIEKIVPEQEKIVPEKERIVSEKEKIVPDKEKISPEKEESQIEAPSEPVQAIKTPKFKFSNSSEATRGSTTKRPEFTMPVKEAEDSETSKQEQSPEPRGSTIKRPVFTMPVKEADTPETTKQEEGPETAIESSEATVDAPLAEQFAIAGSEEESEESETEQPTEPVVETKFPKFKEAQAINQSPSMNEVGELPISEEETEKLEENIPFQDPETLIEPLEASVAHSIFSADISEDIQGEEEDIQSEEEDIQSSLNEEGDSFLTRIPNMVFQYELLPFFEHPRELLVLRCVNGRHAEVFFQRSKGIIKHFDELNEELKQQLSGEMMKDAEQALQKALQALDCLSKADIVELKNFKQPPAVIKQIMDMVLILLGNPRPDWPMAKKLLGEANFMARLIAFDKDNIDKRAILACRKLIRTNGLDHATAKKSSKVGESMFTWVHALVCLYHVPEAQLGNRIRSQIESFNRALDPLRELKIDDAIVGDFTSESMTESSQTESHGTDEEIKTEAAAPKLKIPILKTTQTVEETKARGPSLKLSSLPVESNKTVKESANPLPQPRHSLPKDSLKIAKAPAKPLPQSRPSLPAEENKTAKAPAKPLPKPGHSPSKSMPGTASRLLANSKSSEGLVSPKRVLLSRQQPSGAITERPEISPQKSKKELKSSESLRAIRSPAREQAVSSLMAPIGRRKK